MPVKLETSDDVVAKRLKLAVYGEKGVGKTHFALKGWPDVVIVDTEGGTTFFRPRALKGEFARFRVLQTKSLAKVNELLDEIETGKTKCGTLAIDSTSVLHDVVRDAAAVAAERRTVRQGKDIDEANMTPRDWGLVHRRWSSFMTRLYNLDANTILLGRSRDQYEGGEQDGSALKRIGTTFDADRRTLYQPDVVMEMVVSKGKRYGYIRKDRTGAFPIDSRVVDPSYETFRAVIEEIGVGVAASALEEDADAAVAEADELTPAGPEVRALRDVLASKNLTDDDGAILIGAKLHRPIPSLTVLTPAEARKMAEGISGTEAEALRAAVERLSSKEIA